MIIFVGLGNPGKQYSNTYHNIGFKTADALAERLNIKLAKKGCKALYGDGKVNGQKIIIAKPQTYMNLSGESVLMFKKKYKDAEIVVICDDIDLEKGKLRFRKKGSGGTHNGMRNIVNLIGEQFARLRIGIGKPDRDLADYVLSEMDNDCVQIVQNATDELVKIFDL